MQYTLFTYFQTSSRTFLLFVLLAHRARSRLLQLTRYINYLLTYLLTSKNWDVNQHIVSLEMQTGVFLRATTGNKTEISTALYRLYGSEKNFTFLKTFSHRITKTCQSKQADRNA